MRIRYRYRLWSGLNGALNMVVVYGLLASFLGLCLDILVVGRDKKLLGEQQEEVQTGAVAVGLFNYIRIC